MIEIGNFIELSFLDWFGKISSVIFTRGCNFRCPYCQNYPLLTKTSSRPNISESHVIATLKRYFRWIDGLVISGGEPTLQKSLIPFLIELQKLKINVKLDTNGSNPEVLQTLIEKKLIKAVSMDIKANPLDGELYNKCCGVEVDTDSIRNSIVILLSSDLEVEFRTTVVPTLHTKTDIIEICKFFSGKVRGYTLQNFNPVNTLDLELRDISPFSEREMLCIKEECSKHIRDINLKGGSSV